MKPISIGFVWKLRLSLIAEGSKLIAEGSKIWAEAVIEAYGNVTIEWHGASRCTVNNTDTFDETTA